MPTIRNILNHRFSDESVDSKMGQLACCFAGVAIVPVSVVALVRHPGSRAEFLLGLGLAFWVGVLSVLLGMLCRRGVELRGKVSLRRQRTEFVSYFVCIGVLTGGIWSLSSLNLTPVRVTIGLLVACAASLSVLVLGMWPRMRGEAPVKE